MPRHLRQHRPGGEVVHLAPGAAIMTSRKQAISAALDTAGSGTRGLADLSGRPKPGRRPDARRQAFAGDRAGSVGRRPGAPV